MNIEQPYSVSRAQLLKHRAQNWMPGCFWIVQNQAHVHRASSFPLRSRPPRRGAPSISADRSGGARTGQIRWSRAARHGAVKAASQPGLFGNVEDIVRNLAYCSRYMTKAWEVIDVDHDRTVARGDHVQAIDVQPEDLANAQCQSFPL